MKINEKEMTFKQMAASAVELTLDDDDLEEEDRDALIEEIAEYIGKAVLAERERCATIADKNFSQYIANLIRLRGKE